MTRPPIRTRSAPGGQPPEANIGLAAGAAFWVLDVDYAGLEAAERDGADTVAALQRRFGRLPATVTSLTGGGGWQYLFAPDSRLNNGVKALPGIDTRTTGGYIAVPPSIHPSGRAYRWRRDHGPDEIGIATAPEWLVALLEPVELPRRWRSRRPRPCANLDRYAQAALDRACAAIRSRPYRQPMRHARAAGLRYRPLGRRRRAPEKRGLQRRWSPPPRPAGRLRGVGGAEARALMVELVEDNTVICDFTGARARPLGRVLLPLRPGHSRSAWSGPGWRGTARATRAGGTRPSSLQQHTSCRFRATAGRGSWKAAGARLVMVAVERESIAADVYPLGTLRRHHQVFFPVWPRGRSRAPEPLPAYRTLSLAEAG